ncbi:hypothetical protein BBO99_00001735 [Phytophthora kernoviae]|uniref:Alpha-taxilin n=2 Tax=Phytophthora kernoviae TaxID=325452 RepID=A0A421GYJ7_9STRA|nr:hypothetical protein G195_002282 [Phytophthora kernoviae 00238/432]KAG2530913.1 hypothetical protein JM16_001414 [Phytophthora kernoviae]KAG2531986.1 hypothetical protein JM18_001496 [Phytophthora kernoviae]RLN36722.1 hypothetical protein BBI17_001512 [Phytophthora kernoviae]RLN83873.1 hypothetical protein BBO99_00001735 [Phytophthora kernoviae]
MADADQSRTMEPPSLELKQLGRENKSLKHKHKSKRLQQQRGESSCAASSKSGEPKRSPVAANPGRHHAKRSPKASREDALRELLVGKIAEIEVGGDENLEAPIDLSGIYQDEMLSVQTKEKAEAVQKNEELTAEEKVEELVGSVDQVSEQLRLMQKKIGELNAKCILLKQRKMSTELMKTSTSKAKLEQLCRELQKQNKLIVSESRRIADEEDQKRRELSAQFQKTIEEVSAKMDQQGKDYVASLKENENLQQKLKTFLEQYTAREEHFQKQLEAKDLTVQLAETRLQHQEELTSREAEKVKITLEKAKEFSDREIQLQAQLSSYSEKFDVVQETLTKSNQMFTTFREEMDKMAKTTKKLEKENLALRKKCAAYDSGAIASIQEKVASVEETQKLQEKLKKLESLCRHLQAERNSIRQSQTATTESA